MGEVQEVLGVAGEADDETRARRGVGTHELRRCKGVESIAGISSKSSQGAGPARASAAMARTLH
jgi:hypothetical protein